MSTELDLTALGETQIDGDGPFLLIGLGTFEGAGVTLRRYQTYDEANAVAVNYLGPTHYLFKAGEPLALSYPDHPLGGIVALPA